MLRFIYKLYFIRFKNSALDSLFKRAVIRVANVFLWLNYSLSAPYTGKRLIAENNHPKLIISLTTYPARVQKIWMVIETLLDQSEKADKIILWLYKGEFNDTSDLPLKLQRLQKRGLDIRFCDDNLYPHKKYFYTMQEYPTSDVITADDDILYHPDLVKNLKICHSEYPDSICCSIMRKIKVDENGFLPYKEWKYIESNSEPRFENQMIGAGGVFYPVNSLHPKCFNLEAIEKNALKTDDLWLKAMSLLCGTKVASIAGKYKRLFIPVIIKGDKPLMDNNIGQNENDQNLRKIIENYDISFDDYIDE